MKPYKHQIEGSEKAFEILKTYGLVYLIWEERTGKTLTSILTCEKSSNVHKVLVITTKQAIPGWEQTIKAYGSRVEFKVINYHASVKYTDTDHQIVILDESHVYLSSYPKLGAIWKTVYPLTKGKFIIFMSATPNAQGSVKLFHQLKLSTWSPWARFRDFYSWFREYGVSMKRYIGSRSVQVYDRVLEPKVMDDIKHLLLSCTRAEIGFEHEPIDKVHFVELDENTKQMYRKLEKDCILTVKDEVVVADTAASMLVKLHQIEGGTLKTENASLDLDNTEKIDYILQNFGDSENLVIFYHYKQELLKLSKYFKKAKILQGVTFAEGVDLSMYDTIVVYSMNFSTAKYTQRRARQANIKRDKPITVHFLCVKGAVSDQVYTTVALNKKNFVDSNYERGEL